MPDPDSIFSSPGAERVITLLTPDKSPKGSRLFPKAGHHLAEMRVTNSESVHAWFRRLIGSEERIDDWAINANFAFFGFVDWNDRSITRCSFQALIATGGSLRQLYSDSTVEASYFRLDFDPSRPGRLFSEPQPHIHCAPEGPPRFPFFRGEDEFLLVSFLEFIYVNYFYLDWLAWAEYESRRALSGEVFDSIVESYKHARVLEHRDQLASHLETLRKVLLQAKQERARDVWPLLPSSSNLLSYPRVSV
jgi:hypothetical protein